MPALPSDCKSEELRWEFVYSFLHS